MIPQYGYDATWSVDDLDASIDLAEVSTGFDTLTLGLHGPRLMLQVDVCIATGYIFLEETLNGNNWILMDDSSLVFDASAATISYVKEWSNLYSGKTVRTVLPLITDTSMIGQITSMTLKNKL